MLVQFASLCQARRNRLQMLDDEGCADAELLIMQCAAACGAVRYWVALRRTSRIATLLVNVVQELRVPRKSFYSYVHIILLGAKSPWSRPQRYQSGYISPSGDEPVVSLEYANVKNNPFPLIGTHDTVTPSPCRELEGTRRRAFAGFVPDLSSSASRQRCRL